MSIETQYAKPWSAPKIYDNGGAVFNVKHRRFGAVGDGLTDDAPAIRAAETAVNTAGGGTLFFPPGTYLVADELVFGSDQTWVFAPGASIKLKDNSLANLANTHIVEPRTGGASRVRFVDLHIDGNKANNNSSNSGNGISLAGCTDVHFGGMTIIDRCTRNGVSMSGTTAKNVYFEHLVVRENGVSGVNGGNGLAIVNAENVVVAHVHAKDNYYFGVNIESNGVSGVDAILGVTINGGLCEGTVEGTGFQVYSGTDLSIRGVTVTGLVARENGTHGFGVFGASTHRAYAVQFRGCTAIANQQHGFYTAAQEYVGFVNCWAFNNSQLLANTYDGFNVHRVGHVLTGCFAFDTQGTPTQRYGFGEGTSASHNRYIACQGGGNATATNATFAATSEVIAPIGTGEWSVNNDVEFRGDFEHRGTELGFFSATKITQAADIGGLTDSSGGTADATVAAVSGSGADATINNNFADLVAKVNALRNTLRNYGLMA